jgi:hypothetical protein
MHQRVVTYEDFNGVKHTDTLEFFISEARILENWDIVDELSRIDAKSVGDKKDLAPSEIRDIIHLVKRVSKLGYGKRSDDGTRFRQSDETWLAFEESAAYSAFMLDLFTSSPASALEFVQAIFPTVSEDLKAKVKAQRPDLFEDEVEATPSGTSTDTDISQEAVVKDDRPRWLIENREPNKQEFLAATPEQKLLAYEMKSKS